MNPQKISPHKTWTKKEKEKNFIYISKLDAAKRQLEISIRLFFRKSDVVAIHTLAAATHGVLNDLGVKRGIKSIIKNEMLDRIKKGKRIEYMRAVHEAQNFFKHADKDEKKLLKFSPVQTEFVLYDACVLYNEIIKEEVPIIKVYRTWFCIKHYELIVPLRTKQSFQKYDEIVDSDDRIRFIEEVLPLAEKNSLSGVKLDVDNLLRK